MGQVSNRSATQERAIELVFEREFEEHKAVAAATMIAAGRDFAAAVLIMSESLKSGGKLLFFGNGGSAADAQHISAELVVRYKSDRRAIAAIALTTDTSTLTACGNDLGYDAVFERQIEALGRPGDVAVGISTSGKSPNVLRGLTQARALGVRTVGLTGGSGGGFPALCDVTITVPSSVTARVQEMHILLGHMMCIALERRLGLA